MVDGSWHACQFLTGSRLASFLPSITLCVNIWVHIEMKILWFRAALEDIMDRIECPIHDVKLEIEEIIMNTLKREGECFDVKLSHREFKDCPFCGHHPDPYDPDTIYPVGRSRDLWQAGCSFSAGGCDARVLGKTPYEAIDNWNRRV